MECMQKGEDTITELKVKKKNDVESRRIGKLI
jgi:hypothetical protein